MTTLTMPLEAQVEAIPLKWGSPLFRPNLERMNLIIPFIFIGLGLWAVYAGWPLSSHEKSWLNLVTSFLFLDVTHTGFTFLLFAALPEVRGFLKRAVQGHRLWVILGGAFFIVLPVFLASHWSGKLAMDPIVAEISRWVLMGLWLQHAVAQMFGISLLYNRQSGIDARAALWERRLFNILIFQCIATPAFLVITPFWFNVIFFVVIPPLVVFAILLLSLQQNRRYPSRKFVFQLRLLLWLFNHLHPFALAGVMACHAFEYLCVSERMVQNSKMAKGMWVVVGILSLAFVVYPFIRWSAALFSGSAIFVLALVAGFFRTFDYFHYFVDGILFRFKDEDARRTIGPLLAKP